MNQTISELPVVKSRIRRTRRKLMDSSWSGTIRSLSSSSMLVLLLFVLIAMSWLFGGVDADVQIAAFSLLFGAAVVWAIATIYQRLLPQVTITIWLCGGAVCLAGLQCVNLPQAVAGLVSPKAMELRNSLLDEPIANTTITQGLASTRHATAMLIMASTALFLSSQLLTRSWSLKILFWVFAVNGALLAFVGIVQKLPRYAAGFWPVPTGFASFVNYNNAAGFLNIALATALGLLVSVWQRPSKSSHSVPQKIGWSPTESIPNRILKFAAGLDAMKILAIVLVIIIGAGVIATASRGGILSAAGGLAAVTFAMWTRRRSLLGLGLLVVVLAAIGLVQFTNRLNFTATRLATLMDEKTYAANEGRLGHWIDMLPAMRDFWLTGSGLGTYGDVNRVYQHSSSGEGWFHHADNQYVEAFIDGGVVGLGLMLGCIAVVGLAVSRLMHKHTKSLPIAVCGCFALTSQAIHAMFDLGLYVPANAVAFAILCGAVIGRDDYVRQQSMHAKERPTTWRVRTEQLAVIGTMLIVSLVTLLEFRHEQLSERVQYDSAATLFGWGKPMSLQERWDTAHELLANRPDDARLHLFAAEMHIVRYRVLAAQQLRGELGEGVKEDVLEQATSLMFLHHRVAELRQGPDAEAGIQALRDQAVIHENLGPAREHLIDARQANPYLLRAQLDLAALSFLEDKADDRRHIERAKLISPTHPDVLFWAGFLEHMAGRSTEAYADWKLCLGFTAKHDKSILDMSHEALPVSGIMRQIWPDNPKVLLRLAETYYRSEDREAERMRLLDKVERAIANSRLPEWEQQHMLALVDRQRGQAEKAAQHYKNALKLYPSNSGLVSEFGQFLNEQKTLKDAEKSKQ